MMAILASLGGLLVLFILAGLLLKARDRMSEAAWHRNNPPEVLAAKREAFLQRVRTPDWQFYAEHLQRPVPQALQAWYANLDALAKDHRFRDHSIAFSPIDRAAANEAWGTPGVLPFATSNGDPIYLTPGPNVGDAVLISYHDGGDTELLASSVEAFLAELQETA